MLPIALLVLSAVAFVVTGLEYVIPPGAALSIVGIESTATSEFLLRTEGVALLAAAGLIWAVKDAGDRAIRIALVALGGYFIVSSLVDIVAFQDGVVEAASAPSAALRIMFGGLCLLAATTYVARASSR
jgi:uncharacterized protein YjeT (DUF2065 family)